MNRFGSPDTSEAGAAVHFGCASQGPHAFAYLSLQINVLYSLQGVLFLLNTSLNSLEPSTCIQSCAANKNCIGATLQKLCWAIVAACTAALDRTSFKHAYVTVDSIQLTLDILRLLLPTQAKEQVHSMVLRNTGS